MWKGKYWSTVNTKNRKRKGKLLPKNEEISWRKAYTNTQKFNWNILTITNILHDQKHTVKTIFTMCSHTFTLFWSKKTSMIVKIFQLNFCAFVCAFHLEISTFFCRILLFLFLFLTTWKEKYQSTDNTKNKKRNGKLLPKNEEIFGQKEHTSTPNLNWNI